MVDNRYKRNLLGRCLHNPSIRASLRLRVNGKPLYGLHAQNPPSLTYYVPFLDLSMYYYVFRNEQQFLQPLGNGS
jgi:hypothetical protein